MITLDSFAAFADSTMVTLTDGSIIDFNSIIYDPSSFIFSDSSNGDDISLIVPIAIKRQFPDFDAAAYNEHYLAIHDPSLRRPGSTATLVNFWDQVTTDPLAAPLADANVIAKNSVKDLIGSPAVWLVAVGVVLILIARK